MDVCVCVRVCVFKCVCVCEVFGFLLVVGGMTHGVCVCVCVCMCVFCVCDNRLTTLLQDRYHLKLSGVCVCV